MVGGGVAGVVAAYLLSRHHRVTLIEARPYVGGHTNTVTLKRGPDEGQRVDTGFIVFNDRTYPFFNRFLHQLGVDWREGDMSFGYHCKRTGWCYGGHDLNTLFARRSNLANPDFLRFVVDLTRLNRDGRRALRSGSLNGEGMAEFARRAGYTQTFWRHYLAPLGAAMWSAGSARIAEFPAKSFLQFLENHGLLSFTDRPQWRTVVGGSQSYVEAFLARFQGRVVTGQPVHRVERYDEGVKLSFDGGQQEFDAVVMACHADQALALMAEPTPLEQELLGAWQYSRNHTVLHTDLSQMPPNRRVWSSWNYVSDPEVGEDAASITYDMNRLQGLKTRRRYLVTLNRTHELDPSQVIADFHYRHPIYNCRSVSTQSRLPELNGKRHTYFCGSYFGYGFHEDAVRAAVDVGRRFGIEL